MLNKDNRVGPSQGQSQSTDMSSKQQTVDAWVGIECLNDGVSFVGVSPAIKSHIRNQGHVGLEQIGFDDV